MDSEIINFINNTGFPIVVCFYLFKQNRTANSMQQKLLIEFKDSIKHNTALIESLIEIVKRKRG